MIFRDRATGACSRSETEARAKCPNVSFPGGMSPTLGPLAPESLDLWSRCRVGVLPSGAPPRAVDVELGACVDLVMAGQARYRALAATTGVPWWFMGILHLMECSCSFKRHIHNGDPLAARTVTVPAGRPVGVAMPCTWEASAVDAFELHGWLADQVRRLGDGTADWTLAAVLWRFEAWNGFGYRHRGLRSPYLWAGSTLEQPGRYVSDGVWDGAAWSKQIGAAVVLKQMVIRGVAQVAGAPVTTATAL